MKKECPPTIKDTAWSFILMFRPLTIVPDSRIDIIRIALFVAIFYDDSGLKVFEFT